MEKINHKKSLLNDKLKYYINTIARFCDKCGNPYNTEDLQIIQDTGVSSIIHFSCGNCKSRHIASLIKPIGVSSRMPLNIDLNIEEVKKFAFSKEIESDDVLSLYQKLRESKLIKI